MSDALETALAKCRAATNNAYNERSRVLAMACRLAQRRGIRCGIGKDTNESPEWQNVIYIDLPTGQVSWHIPRRELKLFRFLRRYTKKWDGHSTEEKYRRVAAFARPRPKHRKPRQRHRRSRKSYR